MLEIATPNFGACVPEISSNAAAERCVISPDYCREGEHYRKASEARCHTTDDVRVGTCVSSERCAPTNEACVPGDANLEPNENCDVKKGVKSEDDEFSIQHEWTLYPGCRRDGVLGTTTKCMLFLDECTGQSQTVISASYMLEQGYDTCRCYDVPIGICYPERFAPEGTSFSELYFNSTTPSPQLLGQDIWVGKNSQCATGPWDCDVGQKYMASGEALLTLSTVEQVGARSLSLCEAFPNSVCPFRASSRKLADFAVLPIMTTLNLCRTNRNPSQRRLSLHPNQFPRIPKYRRIEEAMAVASSQPMIDLVLALELGSLLGPSLWLSYKNCSRRNNL